MAACQHARHQVLQQCAPGGVEVATTRGLHAVISTMWNATGLAELHAASTRAAVKIGMDMIGVTVLYPDGTLREISSSGRLLDTSLYALADYPATATVLETGRTVEVHVSDPNADAAEVRVLRNLGYESLPMILMAVVGERPVGVLEFSSRRHRRWTARDIAHARGLAAHLADALTRICA